jgi:hypothetical protein
MKELNGPGLSSKYKSEVDNKVLRKITTKLREDILW